MSSTVFEETDSAEVEETEEDLVAIPETPKKKKAFVEDHSTRLWTGVLNNPECDPDWDESNAKITWAMWQKEVGDNGTPHWQFVCKFKNDCTFDAAKKNLTRVFKKDPHIEEVNCLERTIHYTSKPCDDKDCTRKGCVEVRSGGSKVISATFERGIRPQQGRRNDLKGEKVKEIYDTAMKMAGQGNPYGAIDFIKKKRPREWMMFSDRYTKALLNEAPPVVEKLYSMDDYIREPLTDFSKSILLWGDSENGKTNWALAHFDRPKLIDEIDDLKCDLRKYDALVFDDVNIKDNFKPEEVIKLVDIDHSRSIKARFHNIVIPRGMRRIFTHNEENPFYDETSRYQKGPTPRQKKAIDRRVTKIEIRGDLRKPKIVEIKDQ